MIMASCALHLPFRCNSSALRFVQLMKHLLTKNYLFQAKEMQRAELEELRQREANLTALQAIGPRKKPKLEGGSNGGGDSANTTSSQSNFGMVSVRSTALC